MFLCGNLLGQNIHNKNSKKTKVNTTPSPTHPMHIMQVLKFFVQSACFVYQVLSSKSPLRDQRGICHVFSQLSCSFPGRGFRSKVNVQ